MAIHRLIHNVRIAQSWICQATNHKNSGLGTFATSPADTPVFLTWFSSWRSFSSFDIPLPLDVQHILCLLRLSSVNQYAFLAYYKMRESWIAKPTSLAVLEMTIVSSLVSSQSKNKHVKNLQHTKYSKTNHLLVIDFAEACQMQFVRFHFHMLFFPQTITS